MSTLHSPEVSVHFSEFDAIVDKLAWLHDSPDNDLESYPGPGWSSDDEATPADADLAAIHGDDHDGQFDPNAIELWAQTPDDYWDSLAEFEDNQGPDDWSERARVLGHRIHDAAEGGVR